MVGMIHLFILALLVGVKWCLVLLIDIFLVTHGALHIFMYLLAFSASFVTFLFMSLSAFCFIRLMLASECVRKHSLCFYFLEKIIEN